MAMIHIVYDPKEELSFAYIPPEMHHAHLTVSESLKDQDLYAVAKKLAELMLEQVSK